MEFREVLGQLRRERGMNQEQLAEQIGVSRQAVSKWETGEASPDLPNLLALADALDVSLDILCGRTERDTVFPQSVAEAPEPRKKRWWIGALIAAIVIGMLLPILLALVNYARIETATETTLGVSIDYNMLDYLCLAESLSSVEFTLDGGLLSCRMFCTAENADALHYSVQFIDYENNALAIPAEYRDGVITASGGVSSHELHTAFWAGLRVRDDGFDEIPALLLIPLASNVTLDFSTNSVTWTPVLAQ